MKLDVESLRTLIAVLDYGGMTSAAEQLGTTQSAVSWRLKRLEERLGRPLVIRDGHDLRPSRDARSILDDARVMVELHDRSVARLQSNGLSGTVRVGANEEVAVEQMAQVLGKFRRRHPGARIEFKVSYSEWLIDEIDQGEIDIAVVHATDEHIRPDDEVLRTDRLQWATGVDWPNDDEPVQLVTYGEHCFYRALSEPRLDAAGITHTVSLSVGTSPGVRSAIAAGLGVGVLAADYLGDDVVEWEKGAELGELPVVHQLVRTVPGEQPDVSAALREILVTELRRRPVPTRRAGERSARVAVGSGANGSASAR